MDIKRIVGLALALLLLVMPLAVLAQDGEQEFEEYVSEDGLLTVAYPSGWIANKDSFLYGVELINSQELADQMEAVEEGAPVPAGAVISFVTIVSIDTFQMFGMPIEEGMALDEVLAVFLDFIAAGPQGPPGGEAPEGEEAEGEEAEEMAEGEGDGPRMQMEPPVVGEIEPVELEDGREVVMARVQYPGESDDIYMLFEASDGIYVVFNYFTAPGELTDEQIETAMRIAESVQFTGTADDLVMEGPEIEESDVDPTTLDGDALVEERCTACHTRERIDAAEKDLDGWAATVDRMIGYGAQLNSAERLAVIHYLAGVPLDAEAGMEQFVSEDGLLTIMMPAGWFESTLPGLPFPSALVLNTEEGAARVAAEEDVIEGDKGIFAVVLPLEVFGLFGAEVPDDPSLTELGDFIVSIFGSAPEDATEEELAAIAIGEAEEVELEGGRMVAAVEGSTLYEDGVYFVQPLGEGLVGLVYTVAATGEFDEAQLELGRQAAASLSYEGTADDLMAALLAAPEVEEAPEGVTAADLDGEVLVEERCTVCHTAERIDMADKDEAGWTATVDRMIGYGAQLNSAEREAVIDYLVATH